MRICLDTSAYTNFLRGQREVKEIVDRADWIGIPSVVIGELEAGFVLGKRYADNKSFLDRFVAHPIVQILDVTYHVAEIYGEILTQQRLAGEPIPANDLWIAAVTARAGATLLTYNKRFSLISRIGTICLR